MKKILIPITAAILTFSLTGCKELDKLSELEELAEKMGIPDISDQTDSLTANVAGTYSDIDSTVYDVVSFNADSLNHYAIQTAIKKVVLEGHEYWTFVGVGERMGGVGITHSKSCKCKNEKKNRKNNSRYRINGLY